LQRGTADRLETAGTVGTEDTVAAARVRCRRELLRCVPTGRSDERVHARAGATANGYARVRNRTHRGGRDGGVRDSRGVCGTSTRTNGDTRSHILVFPDRLLPSARFARPRWLPSDSRSSVASRACITLPAITVVRLAGAAELQTNTSAKALQSKHFLRLFVRHFSMGLHVKRDAESPLAFGMHPCVPSAT